MSLTLKRSAGVGCLAECTVNRGSQAGLVEPTRPKLPAGEQVTHGPAGLGFYLPEPIFQSGPIIRLHGKLVLMEFLCCFFVLLPKQVAIKVTWWRKVFFTCLPKQDTLGWQGKVACEDI